VIHGASRVYQILREYVGEPITIFKTVPTCQSNGKRLGIDFTMASA